MTEEPEEPGEDLPVAGEDKGLPGPAAPDDKS